MKNWSSQFTHCNPISLSIVKNWNDQLCFPHRVTGLMREMTSQQWNPSFSPRSRHLWKNKRREEAPPRSSGRAWDCSVWMWTTRETLISSFSTMAQEIIKHHHQQEACEPGDVNGVLRPSRVSLKAGLVLNSPLVPNSPTCSQTVSWGPSGCEWRPRRGEEKVQDDFCVGVAEERENSTTSQHCCTALVLWKELFHGARVIEKGLKKNTTGMSIKIFSSSWTKVRLCGTIFTEMAQTTYICVLVDSRMGIIRWRMLNHRNSFPNPTVRK